MPREKKNIHTYSGFKPAGYVNVTEMNYLIGHFEQVGFLGITTLHFKFYILLFTYIMACPRFSLSLSLMGKFAKDRQTLISRTLQRREELNLVIFLYLIPI